MCLGQSPFYIESEMPFLSSNFGMNTWKCHMNSPSSNCLNHGLRILYCNIGNDTDRKYSQLSLKSLNNNYDYYKR